MENKISLIMSIVNSGYSDKVMEVAKNKGAKGGTVINAIGSAGSNAQKLYGIDINPEKEVIMIIIPSNLSTKILQALYEELGPNTDAKGIAFSLPVEDATSNLTMQINNKTESKEKAE